MVDASRVPAGPVSVWAALKASFAGGDRVALQSIHIWPVAPFFPSTAMR
jgi:hypothetical protein